MPPTASIVGAFLLGFSLATVTALVYLARWMARQNATLAQQNATLVQTIRNNSEVLDRVGVSQDAVGQAINGLSIVIREMTPPESRLSTFERRLQHLEKTLRVEVRGP